MNQMELVPVKTQDELDHAELCHEHRDGRDLFLRWHRETNVLSLTVIFNKNAYQTIIDNDKGMEAMEHPGAYLPDAWAKTKYRYEE